MAGARRSVFRDRQHSGGDISLTPPQRPKNIAQSSARNAKLLTMLLEREELQRFAGFGDRACTSTAFVRIPCY